MMSLIGGAVDIATASLPRRPRLVEWLTFVELGDGRLQMRAADFAFTVREPLLADVVRHLRPMLDGQRTVDELAGSGGAEYLPGTILFVLKLLRQRGVLQESELPPAMDDGQRRRFEPALRLLAHHVVDAEKVLVRLLESTVWLAGDPELCARLRAGLEAVGIGRVEPWSLESTSNAVADDLLITAARTPSSAFFEEVNRACLASGQRWMRVAFEGRFGIVGPTIVPEQTACHTCLILRRSAYDSLPELKAYRETIRTTGEADEGELNPLSATVTAQTVLEAARVLSGFAPPVTFGRQFVFDARSPRVSGHEVLRVPRCPSCARKQSPRDPWDMRARLGRARDEGAT
jgi:bacteriocin biosynthesis cyclodehydratase domain-containing protein